MTPEKLEEFAIRAALGNNGGTWAAHYTDQQKEHWRGWVRALEGEVNKERTFVPFGVLVIGPHPKTGDPNSWLYRPVPLSPHENEIAEKTAADVFNR